MTYRDRREAKAEMLRGWAEKRDEKAQATLAADATYRGDYAGVAMTYGSDPMGTALDNHITGHYGEDFISETCEDRGYVCCDHFPPEKPILEMTEVENKDYYNEHVEQYELLRDRKARCGRGCGRTVDSVSVAYRAGALFVYQGPGSQLAEHQCRSCGFHDRAHKGHPLENDGKGRRQGHPFEPMPEGKDFDSYWCGCGNTD